MQLSIDDHPLLALRAFVTQYPAPLGTLAPGAYDALLRLDAPAPFAPDDALRTAVRDLLRHGGYKPTGRGKPASEYLRAAAGEGRLASINAAVDVGNAVSLHSGLPISVVDVERLEAPLRVGVAEPGSRYVFNAAGQDIDLGGLLCLFDAAGPCANAVKDAQRTKTSPGTVATLTLVWGTTAAGARTDDAVGWAWELLGRVGATVTAVQAGVTPSR